MFCILIGFWLVVKHRALICTDDLEGRGDGMCGEGGLGLLQEGGGLHQQALIYVGEQMAGKLLCLKRRTVYFRYFFHEN